MIVSGWQSKTDITQRFYEVLPWDNDLTGRCGLISLVNLFMEKYLSLTLQFHYQFPLKPTKTLTNKEELGGGRKKQKKNGIPFAQ